MYTKSVTASLLASTFFSSVQAAPRPILPRFPGDHFFSPDVAVYWGQGPNQKGLANFCQDSSIDIIPIGFVNKFPESQPGGIPGSNFGNACGLVYTDPKTNSETEFLSPCDIIAADIKTCQDAGKKILISLGGAAPGNLKISDKTSAESFADFLWKAFGPEDSTSDVPRPFGSVVIDGFDLDIESGPNTGYADLVNHFKKDLFPSGGKKFYISAAPQCVVPDAHIDDALMHSEIDYLFIQFYNTDQCSARSHFTTGDDNDISWTTWAQWLQANSMNKDIKMFIGLPGSTLAVPGHESDYLVPSEVEELFKLFACGDAEYKSMFGGIMVWEATYSDENQIDGKSYAANMKDLMQCNGKPVSSSASSSSSTITSSLTTSTPVTTTTTPYVSTSNSSESSTKSDFFPTTKPSYTSVFPISTSSTATTISSTTTSHPFGPSSSPSFYTSVPTSSTSSHPFGPTSPSSSPSSPYTSSSASFPSTSSASHPVGPTGSSSSTSSAYTISSISSSTGSSSTMTNSWVWASDSTSMSWADWPSITSPAIVDPATTASASSSYSMSWADWESTASSSVVDPATTASSSSYSMSWADWESTTSSSVVADPTTSASVSWEDWSSTTSAVVDPTTSATSMSWADWEPTSKISSIVADPTTSTTQYWADWESTTSIKSTVIVTQTVVPVFSKSSATSSTVSAASSAVTSVASSKAWPKPSTMATSASSTVDGASSSPGTWSYNTAVAPAASSIGVDAASATPSKSVPLNVTPFTGGAPADDLPGTVLSVAACVAIAVLGLIF